MSVAALLVTFVAAGFYAGTKWKVTKVYIAKDPGHPLYFFSALIAIFLFIAALASNHAAQNLVAYESIANVASRVMASLVNKAELPRAAHLSVLCIWAVVLSLLLPRILNWPLNSNGALLDQLAERYGEREAIDDVVRDVLRLQIPLAVTLDDSKVYIGYPISGEPFGIASKRWFRLRPMFSGHRTITRELSITTDYQTVISNFSSDDDGSIAQRAFDVVVPFDRIVSVHPFDLQSYQKYFTGDEWSEGDQRRRLQEMNDIASGAQHDPLQRADYWTFVALLLVTPIVSLFDFWVIAILCLLGSAAFGTQAAYPSASRKDEIG